MTGRRQGTLGQINENDWKPHCSPIKKLKEIKLMDFQYKINNNIMETSPCRLGNRRKHILYNLLLFGGIVNIKSLYINVK